MFRMRAACQQRMLRNLFSQWALLAAERQEDCNQACAALGRAKRISEVNKDCLSQDLIAFELMCRFISILLMNDVGVFASNFCGSTGVSRQRQAILLGLSDVLVMQTRTKASCFSAWARLLDQNDDIVDLIRYRSTQILISAAFKHWRQAVDARAAWHRRALYMETRSYLELMKAAFAGWRQHVADKEAQEQVCNSPCAAVILHKLLCYGLHWQGQ